MEKKNVTGKPAAGNAGAMVKKVWKKTVELAKIMYNLRSLVLSIPVAVLALALAMRNMIELPGEVGLLMQANGEYEFVVVKGIAVLGPMIITAVCLLMTLSSKKVLFPWLISLFSLIIPLMLWVTNAFPM